MDVGKCFNCEFATENRPFAPKGEDRLSLPPFFRGELLVLGNVVLRRTHFLLRILEVSL